MAAETWIRLSNKRFLFLLFCYDRDLDIWFYFNKLFVTPRVMWLLTGRVLKLSILHGNAGKLRYYNLKELDILPDKIASYLYEFHANLYASHSLSPLPVDRSNTNVHGILKPQQVLQVFFWVLWQIWHIWHLDCLCYIQSTSEHSMNPSLNWRQWPYNCIQHFYHQSYKAPNGTVYFLLAVHQQEIKGFQSSRFCLHMPALYFTWGVWALNE